VLRLPDGGGPQRLSSPAVDSGADEFLSIGPYLSDRPDSVAPSIVRQLKLTGRQENEIYEYYNGIPVVTDTQTWNMKYWY
jgi:hypothetical protein